MTDQKNNYRAELHAGDRIPTDSETKALYDNTYFNSEFCKCAVCMNTVNQKGEKKA